MFNKKFVELSTCQQVTLLKLADCSALIFELLFIVTFLTRNPTRTSPLQVNNNPI